MQYSKYSKYSKFPTLSSSKIKWQSTPQCTASDGRVQHENLKSVINKQEFDT